MFEIFEFILDYFKDFKDGKNSKIDKKYNNWLKDENVYNLFKIAINKYYNSLFFYLDHKGYNCNFMENFKNLINLEIKLRKIYKIRKRKLPTFNLFIFVQ